MLQPMHSQQLCPMCFHTIVHILLNHLQLKLIYNQAIQIINFVFSMVQNVTRKNTLVYSWGGMQFIQNQLTDRISDSVWSSAFAWLSRSSFVYSDDTEFPLAILR